MGLISKLKALGAIIGIAGIGAKILSVAKWLPGIGPFASIASAVIGFFKVVLRKAWEGTVVTFANPSVFIIVGTVAIFSFTYGVMLGGQEGARRVAVLVNERETAHAKAEKRLAEALAARDAAEKAAQEAATKTADVPSVAPRASPPPRRARRVRDTAETDSGRFCLPGFPPVFAGCESP